MTTKQITINTILDGDVLNLIQGIDLIMGKITDEQVKFISELLRCRELPDDLKEMQPVEVCKLAAILGLKIAREVSQERRRKLSDFSNSN